MGRKSRNAGMLKDTLIRHGKCLSPGALSIDPIGNHQVGNSLLSPLSAGYISAKKEAKHLSERTQAVSSQGQSTLFKTKTQQRDLTRPEASIETNARCNPRPSAHLWRHNLLIMWR